MKKVHLLRFLILVMVIFNACKEDEDLASQTSFKISYGGISYFFSKGVIWDYGTRVYKPSHFSHAYLIPNKNVFNKGANYTIPANDHPLTLAFFLRTPDSETFMHGTYEIVNDFTEAFPQKFI
jgi:hypothetical protein